MRPFTKRALFSKLAKLLESLMISTSPSIPEATPFDAIGK